MLGVANKDEMDELLSKIREGLLHLPRWEFYSFVPDVLSGADKLCSRP
jgi:hypothetical protein